MKEPIRHSRSVDGVVRREGEASGLMIQAQAVRQALADLPAGTSHDDVDLSVADVYLPRSHLKAMDPDASVVVGRLGTGKTFWWQAMQDSQVRLLVGRSELSRLTDATEVKVGFGVDMAPDDYPSKDMLANLLADNVDPRLVWRTVLARHLSPEAGPLRQLVDWRERCEHARQQPEEIDVLLRNRDRELDSRGAYLLMLFDALDGCADGWRDMYRWIRGLMQLAADMRPYRRIRIKAFLRTDQVEGISKPLASCAELSWPSNELYGLLWHLLANGSAGADLRPLLAREDWESLELQGQAVFAVPRRLVFSEQTQRDMFGDIAGHRMGKGRWHGAPYTWIPNRLADADGKVGPRSFLAAIRTAARDTQKRHPEHEHALHCDSIRRGVREAFEVRNEEYREDYPWVHSVLTALKGMAVPCSIEEVGQRWQDRDVLSQLADGTVQDPVRATPRHIELGAHGVCDDLEALNIFQRLFDGRVNIPDVFRVGYGLGRRGGVKPARG